MGYIRLTVHGRREDAGQLLDWFREQGILVRAVREGEAVVGKKRWIVQWGTVNGINILRLETRKMDGQEAELVCRALFRMNPQAEVRYRENTYHAARVGALAEALKEYANAEHRELWNTMILLIGLGIILMLIGYFVLLP